MLAMDLQLIAQVCSGVLFGDNRQITSLSTDSRHIAPQELFVALKGDRFDGHRYVEQVAREGAGAALLSEANPALGIPYVLVSDTRLALGQIARWQREQFTGPVAAITGSNGKTTVKEMLSAILNAQYCVLHTQGNFNNDIGLPLTLLRLTENHQAMVLELGANHPHEIRYTTEIANPQVALVNNVGDAHIEGFGSRDGVAQEKSAIFTQLGEQGCAVFESDSPYRELFKQRAHGAKCLTFGLGENSDIRASELFCHQDGCYQFLLTDGVEETFIRLQVPGEHNVKNACAAAAMALQMGVPLMTIAKQLNAFSGVSGRLRRLTLSENITLFDDSYNANPNSFLAAMQVLNDVEGYAALVAGDMGELGEHSLAAHRKIGEQAHQFGIMLLATGEQMAEAVEAAGENAEYFADQQALAKVLLQRLHQLKAQGKKATVIVKGSRSSQMEKTVQFIQQNFNRVHQC